MKKKTSARFGFIVSMVLLGALQLDIAGAHLGHEESGFAADFFHVFTGIDHIFAVIIMAAGLFASLRRKEPVVKWSGAATFALGASLLLI